MTRSSVGIGAWAVIPDPLVVEVLGRSGVDWVGLDLQHGAWDLGTVFRSIQLLDVLGVPVYVRVGQDDLSLIPRVCDQGVSGVIIAMVESSAVAARAVADARYQPLGRRSFGGQRYGMRQLPMDRLPEPMVFPMIESRPGLEAVEAIAAVPGIAGLHVGPVDLGLALGLGLDHDAPEWKLAVDRIRAAAHAMGLTATMHAVTAADAQTWADAGFDELILRADVKVLQDALTNDVSALRQLRI